MLGANPFQIQSEDSHEESFWPSFTDIMMVILMIFLLVTVAVILANTRLMQDLRSSVMAQEKASQLAEFTIKENATLEEQLDYYKQLTSSTEMELLRSRAKTEETRTQLDAALTELSRAEARESTQSGLLDKREQQLADLQKNLTDKGAEASRLQTELQQAQRTLSTETGRLETELKQARQDMATEADRLRTELEQTQTELTQARAETTEKDTALSTLREQTETNKLALANLEGDYAELDKKYQKLLKPSRSAKGKTVVEVVYQRSGYQIRPPGESVYHAVGATELDAALGVLKSKHGDDLYVKIVIPQNSGLSYNDAWAFTRDTLSKYDYYYQENSGDVVGVDAPAEGSE